MLKSLRFKVPSYKDFGVLTHDSGDKEYLEEAERVMQEQRVVQEIDGRPMDSYAHR